MAAIARRYGSIPREARVVKRSVRSLEAIAIDNARRGLRAQKRTVRSSRCGSDASVRSSRSGRARSHRARRTNTPRSAGKSPRGSPVDWTSKLVGVERARRDASRAIAHIAETDPSDDLQRVAGVPPATVARAMAEHLAAIFGTSARAFERVVRADGRHPGPQRCVAPAHDP
jgi:hypothetical protein